MGATDDLKNRLSEALDRVATAVAKLPDPGALAAQDEELETLRAKLAQERGRNEELVARVQALKDRQESQVAQMEKDLKAAEAQDAEKSSVMQELKSRVDELRDQVARLTEANRAMVGDAELVNTAMMAELDAMRASRRADAAEIDDILTDLQPHLAGGAHA